MDNENINIVNNNENILPRKCLKSSKSFAQTKSTKKSRLSLNNTSKEKLKQLPLFEEMGISMLDSEESTSSAASALTLMNNTKTNSSSSSSAGNSLSDENSNEATPNLLAPKLYIHERAQYSRASDQAALLNLSSNDNSNSNSLPNYKEITSKRNNSQIYTSEMPQNIDSISSEKIQSKSQYKMVPVLGEFDINTTTSSATSNQSNSNSPAIMKTTRSPLATVTCNTSYNKNTNKQQLSYLSSLQQHYYPTNGNGQSAVIPDTNYIRSYSPTQSPCTSQQTVLVKQQLNHQYEQEKLQFQVKSQLKPQKLSSKETLSTLLIPNDNFFLYRHDQSFRLPQNNGTNYFNLLSDEMILQIFKWLPKKALIRSSCVSRRFNRCANDETLWTRLDLGSRALRAGALGHVIKRGVVILRLAQSEISHPSIDMSFMKKSDKLPTRLQYLDLSMVSITKPSLKLLLSHCCQLKKLSLEHVPLNDEICHEISKNDNLETLNLTMCSGLEPWSVSKMMKSLNNLSSLNISWTNLSVDAITKIVTNITPNLLRLNIAGCRKTMFDSHLISLSMRCTQLLELDLSDCTGLTEHAISILSNFQMLEYLSLSRCYLIPVSAYMDLNKMVSLSYLDVFGMLSDTALDMLERYFPNLGINKFIHSSVARPTVGNRRTSIWGLRTRDNFS